MSMLQANLPDLLRLRGIALPQEDGMPLDQFIASAVAEKVAVLDAVTYIQERAGRGSRDKFEHVLARVPNVEPEPHDQLPPENLP